MRNIFIFLIALFILPQVSFAKDQKKPTWGYKKFPLVLPQAKDYLPKGVRIGKRVLRARRRAGAGTHTMWGIEQLYSDIKLTKFVLVKKNVEVFGKNVIGGWRSVGKGSVLHLRYGDKVTAYYAEGLNSRERFLFESQIRKFHKVSDFINPLIRKAYAETTGVDVTDPEPTTATPELALGPSGLAGAAAICMGERAADAALEAGGNAIDAIGNAGQELLDDPAGALRGVRSWVADTAVAAWDGAGEAIGNAWEGTKNVASAAWNGAGNLAQSAWDGTLWSQISDSVEKTRVFLQKSYTFLVESVEGFASLPPLAQAEILCEFGIQAAQVGVVSAIMAATGIGAAAAGARVMAFLGRFGARMAASMPALQRVIEMADLSENEKIQRIRDMFRNGAEDSSGPSGGTDTPVVAAGTPNNPQAAARLGMTQDEYSAMLARNMDSDLPDADRLRLAREALGDRVLTAEQQAAILRAHETGVMRPDGTFSQEDLLAKARILREAGFESEDVRALMDRGITGVGPGNGTSLAARTPDIETTERLQYDEARAMLEAAGISNDRIDALVGRAGYNRGVLSPAESEQVWGALNGQANLALRGGSLTEARTLYGRSHDFISDEFTRAIAEGGNPDRIHALGTRAFATRGVDPASTTGARAIPRSDDFFDRALNAGYFDTRIGSRSFSEAFDPTTQANLNLYDPRVINRSGLNPEEVYLRANRQYQELLGIASYLNRPAYQRPPMPAWLEGVEIRQVTEYMRIYRRSMDVIEQNYLGN